MENGFSNLSLTTSNQSISGAKDYKVQKLDFDTSCPCQITACDGGTIKVCAKMEIDDLVIDSLCIDGELGCDTLVVETGITEGIKFTDDPCDATAARRLALYEDGSTLTLQSQTGRSLNLISSGAGVGIGALAGPLSMTSTTDTNITSFSGDINITSSTSNINITSTDKDLSISSHENFTINCGGYSNANEVLTINAVNSDINCNSGMFRIGLDYPASPNLVKGEVATRPTTAGPAMNFKNLDTNTNEGTMTGMTSINGWVVPCDKRIKENIKKIDHGKKMERYDKLNKIDIVSYDYKKNVSGLLPINRHIDTGFTTQQLTSVGLDDCVVKQADDNDPQVPNQNTMIALLINAVQVLQDKVKQLE